MDSLRSFFTGQQMSKNPLDDAQLSRRKFLAWCGAAIGSGALLNSTPAAAKHLRSIKPYEQSFLSNSEELFWRMVRGEFALKDELIYMNTGTLGAVPNYVLDKVKYHFQVLAEDPFPTAYYPPYDLGEAHTKAASFLGANADEIIVTGSTTEGMSFVANGLELEAGDEVLTTMHEHNGGLDCWKILRDRRGITLTMIPFQDYFDSKNDIVDLFANAITSNTRVMSFCHMNYTTGLKMPVKELCTLARNNGIISVVDGAHAIGMLDLDMHDLGCDFYACAPHKWLCAPPGVGVLYAKKDSQHLVWPTVTESYGSNFQATLEWRGQRTSPALVCLKDAMDFQDAIIGGRPAIEARIMQLSTYAKMRLLEIPGVSLHCALDPEQSSGLVSFYIKNETKSHAAINSKIRADYNIIMRTVYYKDYAAQTPSKTGLRISTHIYNNFNQIDLLARAIEENLSMM